MTTLKSVRTLLSGAAAAAMICAASVSHAADESILPTAGDTIETYWSAKWWTVFKNTTRQSCFIEWRGETSAVQAGLTKAQDAGYLGAFLKDVEFPEGEREVAIVLNGNLYVGNATTVSQSLSGGFTGAYIVVNNPRFITDLEEAREFVAFQDTPNTVTVSLKTPRNAIERARICMDSF
ncbi:hypothetical protein [Shimia sediminis]|uniref:hypothetical protein n=1 Tax=Shimia sediminis TaxID=2497945 RepID=UPI000F8EC323|nr:hypothetical protein [Shimia sediminis]